MKYRTFYSIIGTALMGVGAIEVYIGDRAAATIAFVCGYNTILFSRLYKKEKEVGYFGEKESR